MRADMAAAGRMLAGMVVGKGAEKVVGIVTVIIRVISQLFVIKTSVLKMRVFHSH